MIRRYASFDGGLMQQLPSHMLPEVFTPDALNVEITPAGRLRLPRLGAKRFRSSAVAGARIDGLWELRRADGTWIYVLACAGSLYTMDASTTLATLGALTDTKRRWSAVTYGGRLLIFNGSDMPQSFKTELERLRDVEDASLPVGWKAGNWPARVALLGAGEVEQLACWGLARERSSVYFSEVKNPLVWNSLQSSTAGRVIVREEDGEEVVAVVDFAGLTLVMKETVTVGYFDLDPHAGTAAGMKVYPWGCASADSLIRYENGLAWWARWKGGHGPLTLSAVQDYADIAAEAMTWRIQPALNEVSPSHLALISGYWNGALDCCRWFAPSRKSAKATLLFDYYPRRQARDETGRRFGAFHVGEFAAGMDVSCVLPLESEGAQLVLAGDSQGYINRLHFGQTDLGVAIESRYVFPALQAAAPVRIVGFDALTAAGGGVLEGGVSWDGSDFRAVGASLTPNRGDDRTCSAWPFGAGRHVEARLRHLGTDQVAEFEALLLEIDAMRNR